MEKNIYIIFLGDLSWRTTPKVKWDCCSLFLPLSAYVSWSYQQLPEQQSTGYLDADNHVYLGAVSRFSTSSDILKNVGEINPRQLHVC